MVSVIRRGIEIIRTEGILPFIRRSLLFGKSKLTTPIDLIRSQYRGFLSFYWASQGSYSLTLAEQEVMFLAKNQTTTFRNLNRFKSESDEIAALLRELEADDVFYDIGANTGLYTCFAAERCRDGQVVAFEPYPPNVDLLKQNVSHNRFDNVDIHEVALSDTDGTIGFDQPKEDDAGFGSSAIDTDQSGSTTEVPTKSGDEMIAEGLIPAPNVLKIDVEGSEPLVLDGLENTLSSPDCRLVYCEVHLPAGDHRPSVQDFGSSLDEMMDRLRGFGFTVEKMQERGPEVFIKGMK